MKFLQTTYDSLMKFLWFYNEILQWNSLQNSNEVLHKILYEILYKILYKILFFFPNVFRHFLEICMEFLQNFSV